MGSGEQGMSMGAMTSSNSRRLRESEKMRSRWLWWRLQCKGLWERKKEEGKKKTYLN